MRGISGYFFDTKTFNKKVSGYKELSPKEKWGLRVILDFISLSEDCSVEDIDSAFMAETGFTRAEWVKIKQRLMVFDCRILSLCSGVWVSPWMKRQRKIGAISESGNSTVTIPIINFIEDFGNPPEDGIDMEREFVNESSSALMAGDSPSDYATKVNENIIKAFGLGG